ncbi:MAG: hypothetical protein AAGA48_03390 [Myxococcota bacterium]
MRLPAFTFALAMFGCAGNSSNSASSGDTDSPDLVPPMPPTGETGTPAKPALPSATVHVMPAIDGSFITDSVIVLSNADGTYLRTVELSEATSVVIEDVPVGGSVTWAYFGPTALYFETMAEVQANDELWFRGPVGFPPSEVLGSLRIQMPVGPGVAYDRIGLVAPCSFQNNPTLPLDQTLEVEDRCASSDLTQPLDTVAYATQSDVTVAIAYATDLQWAGTAPTATLETAMIDNWRTDFGQVRMRYAHSGDDLAVVLRASAFRRGRVTTPGELGAFVPSDGAVLELEPVVSDDDYHRYQIFELGGFELDEGEQGTRVWIYSDDIPGQGEFRNADFDVNDLPMRGATFAADFPSRTATVTLPNGWSCGGRPANFLSSRFAGSKGKQFYSWEWKGPFAATHGRPTLSPELEQRLSAIPQDTATVFVHSLEGGYGRLHTSPMIWELPEAWLVDNPSGSRVCQLDRSTARVSL